jgi:hypothetical protein
MKSRGRGGGGWGWGGRFSNEVQLALDAGARPQVAMNARGSKHTSKQ